MFSTDLIQRRISPPPIILSKKKKKEAQKKEKPAGQATKKLHRNLLSIYEMPSDSKSYVGFSVVNLDYPYPLVS